MRSCRGFLKFLYFGLEVLQMLLLAFTKGTLSGTVLRLPFLISLLD